MRSFKEAIKELNGEIDRVAAELKRLQDARNALQKVCAHNWQYDGHGHNDSHYTCTECGADKWE